MRHSLVKESVVIVCGVLQFQALTISNQQQFFQLDAKV
jgi:hypothetical protein